MADDFGAEDDADEYEDGAYADPDAPEDEGDVDYATHTDLIPPMPAAHDAVDDEAMATNDFAEPTVSSRMMLDSASIQAADPPLRDEMEFDEDLRFVAHEMGRFDDAVERLARAPGVLSATIIEMSSGRVIATTLDVAAAARYAEHVHGLAHRAQLCASIGSSSSTDETDADDLQMLCIGSRHRELLLCADRISGTAVIVEQDRHFVQPAANAKSKSDEEWLRRQLVGDTSPSAAELVGLTLDDLFIGRT